MDAGKCRFPALNAMGLVGGRFDHQPKPLIWRVFGQSLRTCVQRKSICRVRTYAAKRPYSPLWGSRPPAIGGEVRLHKGFDTEKAPDTSPGRVDDVVGGFQIIPALVGDQRIAEPSGLDRIQAVLLTPHPVDLIQLFRAGAGICLQADVALGFEEIEHIVVVPLHQFFATMSSDEFKKWQPQSKNFSLWLPF